MAGGHDQDKTEAPTPKKRADAREKGQLPNSRELTSVVILMTALGVFFFGGAWMFGRLTHFMRTTFEKAGSFEFGITAISAYVWTVFASSIAILAPVMGALIFAGVFGNVSQNGFLLTSEPLTPKLSKLNPLSGLKRLFSLKSLTELIKSVLKILIVGTVSYVVVRKEMAAFPGLVQLAVIDILVFISEVAFKTMLYISLVMILMAIADVAYQRWQHEKDLRMTKQEVKDEAKQQQGDPTVKARIRAVQRELARQRMMAAVPEATVVITNPTRLAIALKFEKELPAPVVLAKGAGHVAAKIRAVATENGVPIVEQKPLARSLFKLVEVGDYIPAELYRAVAEVLAYVYRLKGLVHAP
ncbi:MAG: flagellar biosynthesis protein FlhB [Desulfosarcinaceae bacterium]|nr:flagellar biosynthesis protein FlhB [Desulfosarcinaceae bacterium]